MTTVFEKKYLLKFTEEDQDLYNALMEYRKKNRQTIKGAILECIEKATSEVCEENVTKNINTENIVVKHEQESESIMQPLFTGIDIG